MSRGIPNLQRYITKRVECASPKPLNFAFSGAGFLISYHLGVASYLQEKKWLTEQSKVAGASSGALTALSIATGQDLLDIQKEVKEMAFIGSKEGFWGKVEPRLRRAFQKRYHTNVDLERLSKRLTIVTHQLWPKWEIVHADSFDSLEDLYGAVMASSHVPFYLTNQFWTPFRGQFHVDGALYNLVPEMPGYQKVCVLPARILRRSDYDISPSLDPDFPHSYLQLLRFALFPPKPRVLDELFELGRKGAAIWEKNNEF